MTGLVPSQTKSLNLETMENLNMSLFSQFLSFWQEIVLPILHIICSEILSLNGNFIKCFFTCCNDHKISTLNSLNIYVTAYVEIFLHSWSKATLTLVWCNSDMLQNSSLSYFVEIFLNLCLAGILVCSFPCCLFWFYITVLLPQHGHAGLIEWCRRVACLWILWILGVLQETSVLVFFSRFGEVQQWMYLFLDIPLLETFHY